MSEDKPNAPGEPPRAVVRFDPRFLELPVRPLTGAERVYDAGRLELISRRPPGSPIRFGTARRS